MIAPARRHGHSDPRFSAAYFVQFSPRFRASAAARRNGIASTALAGWEDEGGASALETRSLEPATVR